MTGTVDLDSLRKRWRDYRLRIGMADSLAPAQMIAAGLAARLERVSSRVAILPRDPLGERIEFDDNFWAWWEERRNTPFGEPLVWNVGVPTATAAVQARTAGEGWATYLAVHRHGGVESGTDDTYVRGEARHFCLVHTVGLVWIAIDRQARVLEHYKIQGPWELTIWLYDTKGAYLGQLGQGPGRAPTCTSRSRCLEPYIGIRTEVDDWPSSPDDIRGLAFRVGGHIEEAWGSRHRRFVDRDGEREGQFSRNSWRL